MMIRKTPFTNTALSVGISMALAMPLAASAENNQRYQLSIESQSVANALVDLSRSTKSQIILANGISSDFEISGVVGEHTLTSALDTMLEGSGLTYQFISDDSVVIQQEEKEQAQEAEQADEEVVITGTRLKGVWPTSKVITITSDEIRKSGAGSTEDVIRNILQNFAGQSIALSADSSQGFNRVGESRVNLKGLGAENTLVLVNGRRLSGAASQQGGNGVNIANIPLAAIDRIEVITDGASAIYGADAVGGVLNFIYKKDYNGATTSLRYGSNGNGGDTMRLSQLVGFNWEGGNLTASLSVEETTPVSAAKAGRVTNDFRSVGGNDFRGTLGENGTFARVIPPSPTTPPSREFLSFPADSDGSDLSPADFNAANFVPADFIAPELTPTEERVNFTLSANQEITESIELFLTADYSKNESSRQRVFELQNGRVPTSNAFSPFLGPITLQYLFDTEFENGLYDSRINAQQENTNFVLGGNFELTEEWSLEVSVAQSEDRSETNGTTLDSGDALAAALASDDPATALNLFGNGEAQNGELLRSLIVEDANALTEYSTETTTFQVKTEGHLLDMPAGEVRLAAVAEARQEGFDIEVGFFPLVDSTPERDVMSVALETSLPFVSPEQNAAINSLNVSLAARWDDYSTTGAFENGVNSERTFSNVSPRVGLSLGFTDSVTMRASWGEAFRAPTLFQMFFSRATSNPFQQFRPPQLTDPLRGDVPVPLQEFDVAGNPDLGPELSDTYSLGIDVNDFLFVDGLSASLNYSKITIEDRIASIQERFDFGTADILELVADPAFDGLIVQRTPFDAVFVPPTAPPGPEGLSPLPGQITLLGKSINTAVREQESVDASISYLFDTDYGSFNASLEGSFALKLDDQTFVGDEVRSIDGTRDGIDRTRLRFILDWSKNNYGATATVNYSSSYVAIRSFVPRNSFAFAAQELVSNVSSYTTFDLTGFYDFGKNGVRLNGGIRNLFDKGFPFVNDGSQFDTRRVDVRGRIAYLEVTKQFDF